MKVRAIATATDRSNAIGAVEIECEPTGLTVTYLGVGAYSEGFAPGALTHGTRVHVPWPCVLEARAEGDRIFLAVEPRLTPHHRLCLAGFTSREVVDARELFRQRLVIWVGAGQIESMQAYMAINFAFGFFGGFFVVGFAQVKELFPMSIVGTTTAALNIFPFAGGAVLQQVSGLWLASRSLEAYQGLWLFMLLCAALAGLAAAMSEENVADRGNG